MSRRAKGELRNEMRRILANLDHRWLQAASRQLGRRLSQVIDLELDTQVEHILAWVSFFPGEVDLTPFINEQLDKRQIYLPQIRADSMHFISIGKEWMGAMAEGNFGIPEPGEGRTFSFNDVSRAAILVPGVAFDRSGGRLGRGKGYYDNLLSRSRLLELRKIGVCWSLQVMPQIPMESHDVYMDWIVTEEEQIPTLGTRAE